MRILKLQLVILGLLATGALAAAPAQASRTQWSMFEDHTALIRASSPTARANRLREIKDLGADTIRIQVHWNEVAPQPNAKTKPRIDSANPLSYTSHQFAYPSFFPYDDTIRQANAMGFRILLTITGDTPRWATAGAKPIGTNTANYKPNSLEFARFATAVAKRYSGRYPGIPAVRLFSIWNEPNHAYFLKPHRDSPRIYRNLVNAALPAIRANAASGSRVFVGELAPVGRAPRVIGPTTFFKKWLCLNNRFKRGRGSGCGGFKKIKAQGFAHHPYGPADRVAKKRDIINMLAIGRLAKYLDAAGRAGRISGKLPIYNTEFGYQSNPPDRTVSTSPSRQAQILNEKEEFSYRFGRLRSFSQYLLTDDPARKGPASLKWSGFQTGLRYPNGGKKPAYDAYRFPIVVHRRRGGVQIWGRVRPGSGVRSIRLERRTGARFKREGKRINTKGGGYFGVKRSRVASYRFRAYDGTGPSAKPLGYSRTAAPIR
jgi:Cellulase (glycosyl hydrolase family 5)